MGKPTRELLFRLALNMGDVRLEMYLIRGIYCLILTRNTKSTKSSFIFQLKKFWLENFEFIGNTQFLKILKVHKIAELFKKCWLMVEPHFNTDDRVQPRSFKNFTNYEIIFWDPSTLKPLYPYLIRPWNSVSSSS